MSVTDDERGRERSGEHPLVDILLRLKAEESQTLGY